jgi:hypothetical protein
VRARTNVRAQRADAVGPRPLELIVRLQFGHAPSVEIDGVRASSFSRRNLGALSDQVFLDQQLHRRAPNGASLSVPYFESGPIPRSVPPALGHPFNSLDRPHLRHSTSARRAASHARVLGGLCADRARFKRRLTLDTGTGLVQLRRQLEHS